MERSRASSFWARAPGPARLQPRAQPGSNPPAYGLWPKRFRSRPRASGSRLGGLGLDLRDRAPSQDGPPKLADCWLEFQSSLPITCVPTRILVSPTENRNKNEKSCILQKVYSCSDCPADLREEDECKRDKKKLSSMSPVSKVSSKAS